MATPLAGEKNGVGESGKGGLAAFEAGGLQDDEAEG